MLLSQWYCNGLNIPLTNTFDVLFFMVNTIQCIQFWSTGQRNWWKKWACRDFWSPNHHNYIRSDSLEQWPIFTVISVQFFTQTAECIHIFLFSQQMQHKRSLYCTTIHMYHFWCNYLAFLLFAFNENYATQFIYSYEANLIWFICIICLWNIQ